MQRKPFEQRLAAMVQEAQSWLGGWKDICAYICPDRGYFEGTLPNQGKKYDHKTQVDSTAKQALTALGSGMTSGLSSPSRPWFKLLMSNRKLMKIDAVKQWLATVEEILLAIFGKSNTYSALNNGYEELGGPGTAAIFVEEDFKNVIRLRSFTVGEYVLGMGADGNVNAFGRNFQLTVGQLVTMFGIDNVSDGVKSQYKNNSVDGWVDVCHLIEENDKRIPDMPGNKHMPYRSAYWEKSAPQDKFLRIGGYEEFPALTPRWNTSTTSQIYGRGPGWEALGDVKMLQSMQVNKLQAIKLLVKPPMQAPAGVNVNILPGGITRTGGTVPDGSVKPSYEIRPDIAAIQDAINDTKQGIKKSFFNDLFLMLSNSTDTQKTVLEVSKLYEEKLLLLGPVVIRQQNELLNPLITRTFNIAFRAGVLPPPPPELEGGDIQVEYISTLAQAQKQVGIVNIQTIVKFAADVQAINPNGNSLDKVDLDEAIDRMGELIGGVNTVVRSDDKVAAIRADRQKQAEAEQKALAAQQMIDSAKILADTKMGDDNALTRMMPKQTAGK